MTLIRKHSWKALLAGIMCAALLGTGAALAQASDGGDAPGPLWQKLDALRAALAPEALENLDDQGVTDTTSAATGLLIGNAEEPGLIALVEELAGVSREDIGDPNAVILAGNDRPAVLALAHLLAAADTLTTSYGRVALAIAGQHVDQAYTVLAPLRPDEAL
mgnify:CR=1 FL=1